MARVVVVGAGLGGAAVSARLAKQGHTVTLVERRGRVGGALGGLERGGFTWSTGPSALALPAAVRDLFAKTGRPLEREGIALVPEPIVREHRFADGSTLALPWGSRSRQASAVDAALGSGLGGRWARHVQGLAEPWDLLRRDVLERPYVAGRVSPRTERLLRSRTTLHRAARRLHDPRLALVATHHAVQGGHDPRRAPHWLGVVDYLEQVFGVWTTEHGLRDLTDLLGARLRRRGVEVLLDCRARDIVMGARGPRALATDAGEIAADVVVTATDPAALPALAAHLAGGTRPAPPPAVTHLGLGGEVPRLPHEVVLHGTPTLTVRTRGQAPPGGAAWTVLSRGRSEGGDVLARLAAAGLDVRSRVEVRVDRSPEDQVALLGGSPYGVLWRGRGTAGRRCGPRSPLPGVYAVGAHVAPLGQVPLVALTAAVVGDLVGPAGPAGR